MTSQPASSRQASGPTLWHHRDFLRLWAGDTISQAGTMITLLAMPLLAVKVLHATAFEVGVLTACETLAFLLVGLPAGAWVDRMRRRNVLIAGDLGRAALLGSVPLAWYLDVLTLGQLYVVVLLVGVLTVFFDVAYQSYLPHLVGREHLVEGNAKLQASQSVSQVAGPSVGGFLVQVLGAPYAILLDALSFVWSAACVTAIRSREPRPEAPPERHLLREIREGLAFVLRHRLLRSIAATTGISNLFSTVGQTALIVLLASPAHLNLSGGAIGLLFTLGGVGGLVGAVLAARVARWVGQGPAIWLSGAATAPFLFVQPFVRRDWTLGLLAASTFVIWAGVVVYNITQVSFRQGLCPERLLGRMNATMRFLVWGTMPLGGIIGGMLASLLGLRPTLLVAAVGGALSFLPVYLSPLRWMRELPQTEEPVGGPRPGPTGGPTPGAGSSPADGPQLEPATPGAATAPGEPGQRSDEPEQPSGLSPVTVGLLTEQVPAGPAANGRAQDARSLRRQR